MVYATQVQGVREVQGEQGADSVGQAGVQSQWADAAGFVRTVKEVLRSRDCRLDSQVSGLRTEPVAWLAVVGEAVVVTPEYGSIPHGWWFAVLEQGQECTRAADRELAGRDPGGPGVVLTVKK